MQKNFEFVGQVLLSVLTLGVTWVVSNQAAVVTALAIVIVWLLKYLAERRGIVLSKVTVTGVLYVIAFGLVIVINPSVLPAWPALTGDAVEIIRALALWVQQATVLLLPYTGAAMTLYNMLLKNVLDQLPGMFSVSAETLIG